MKYILIILSLLFLTSCNPFISKDLRRKNRANRKLEKLVRKFPELKVKDTLITNFDTTIIIEPTKIDTLVSFNFDTLEVIKDKFHLKLIKTTDTLLIEGGCKSDTIYIDRDIVVPFESVKTVKLTIFEQIMTALSKFWWAFVLFIFLFIILFLLKKTFLSK